MAAFISPALAQLTEDQKNRICQVLPIVSKQTRKEAQG